ncbi:hypothetical protein FJTKL_01048 [Diaporthe vaccinii]|uniref:Uncharacterized protein n=1 Tax=Diaporthe vaccinii TaxID=105482 RepID=A0ABR4E1I1_9PEZI
MLISGSEGRLYWFFFSRLPETKYGKAIPRYTDEDEAQFVKENAYRPNTETINFGHVFEKRISSTLTPLHENVFEKWFFRRPQAEPYRRTGIDGLGSICRPAVRIDKLPIPKRPRSIPYDDELPVKPIHSMANLVVQLLVVGAMLFLLAISVLTLRIPFERPAIWGRDGPLVDRVWFSGAPALNEFTNFLVSAFSLQVGVPDIGPKIHIASQLTSYILIWIIESYRAGNKGSLITLPIIPLCLMQLQGIFRMEPLYVIFAVFEGFDLSPGRFVRPAVAKSLIPALVLGYIIPTILMILPTSNVHILQTYTALWQPTPAFVAVLVSVFSRVIGWWDRLGAQKKKENDKAIEAVRVGETSKEGKASKKSRTVREKRHLEDPNLPIEETLERYKNPDLPILQAAYSVLFWLQAAAHISTFVYTYHHPDLTIRELFFGLRDPFAADWGITDPVAAMMAFLQYDMVVSASALVVYELFSVWKLRQVGYVTTRPAAVAALGVAAGQLTVGPGATWAALWSWRENVLANVAPVR